MLEIYGPRKSTILSTVCLLTCVGLWEASYVCLRCGYDCFRARLEEGRLEVAYLPLGVSGCRAAYDLCDESLQHGCEAYGFFGWDTLWLPHVSWTRAVKRIEIPFWIPTLLFCILPFRSVFIGLQRRVRRAKGCCAACGYDLRASRDRCPECGSPFGADVCDSPPIVARPTSHRRGTQTAVRGPRKTTNDE